MITETSNSSSSRLGQSPEDSFFDSFDWSCGVMEWGAPHGRMARWLPVWLVAKLHRECLWVMDQKEMSMYPCGWSELGVNLAKVHFLQEEKPLKSFKSLIHDHPFSILVLDVGEFLKAGDLNFITQLTRQSQKPCFLIRHFYLSHRNGNPFAKCRFNSFYDFNSNQLKVTSLKGPHQHRSFLIPFGEER